MNDELASSLVRRALVADVVCVILFATIGRACHGEALSPGGLLRTGTPFVLGLAVGWVIVVTARIAALRWLAGVVLWGTTLIVGMAVRYFTGQGIAVAFVIVAASFLALTLIGWRAVVTAIRSTRRKRHT
ncbi:DUF3054 domain-containing protein [Propionibacterium sp. NM47_B9-13]|uniref:DUF3054 domain-containing protein n=2 Tax=Cutibacterium modestum TaxID=2559073 RepID=A0AAD1NUU7_9ACTN|nr:DUF3054 domain-containing protein [Cutibacterium modestum]TGY29240.1 DUF3054 domain-containing protein [Propionibacterium sp. NM47_B9-13]AOH44979.1 hypothetical protein BCB70_02615 [Cutibacterium modestum]EFS75438.1 hypothetical protein HMPREF9621_00283 [Cutibacterium modestum HL037PA2]EFS91225.1 hypothetical protein HMPREF9607_02515 [Cutibacterium modestum HL044PA1]EFT16760.1 hypothetical protein HMPREF9622_00305 [Cutibacterium modestum HL037PA3]